VMVPVLTCAWSKQTALTNRRKANPCLGCILGSFAKLM
jgi:hypothetical protein